MEKQSEILVRAEKKDGIYAINDTIIFNVEGRNNQMPLEYTISDGEKITQRYKLENDKISYQMNRAGFVLVKVYNVGDEDYIGIAGAAVDPEKIKAGTYMPKDFNQFWQQQVETERNKKIEVIYKKELSFSNKAFDIKVKRGDIIVSGFIIMPEMRDSEDKREAFITFQGASKVYPNLITTKSVATLGVISLNINFHGSDNIENPTPEQNKEISKNFTNYQYKNVDNKDKYYMKDIFLRILLAVDFVTTLDEYDGKTLIVQGGSLGGCQAIVAAALASDKVSFCSAAVPAMSDHLGNDANHLAGWPNIIEQYPQAKEVMPYFDMVNMAKNVKCPIALSAGFIDVIVPPASVYAVYNNLVAKKKIYNVVTAGHGENLIKGELDVAAACEAESCTYLNLKRLER